MITGTETKEEEATIDTQINCNNIDFLTESCIHHSSYTIEEEEDDIMALSIQIDCNIVDPLAELLTCHSSLIIQEETKITATQNTTTNKNNIKSLIVGLSTDIGKQAQLTSNNKRKLNKNKRSKGKW